MTKEEVLENLEQLKELIKQNISQEAVAEKYGLIQNVYCQIIPNQVVLVPQSGGRKDKFPNYFEAGYLSGRTFHRHQGRMELNKVIGVVKSQLQSSNAHNIKSNGNINLPDEQKRKVTQYIIKGDAKSALTALIEDFESNQGNPPSQLYLLFFQLSQIEKKEMESTMNPESIQREKNQIVKSLLSFIDSN